MPAQSVWDRAAARWRTSDNIACLMGTGTPVHPANEFDASFRAEQDRRRDRAR
jgi:hypothetical protein